MAKREVSAKRRNGGEAGDEAARDWLLGSHLSIAGNMCNALREAEGLGLQTVQVFTKNQQQWKTRPLEQGVIDEWKREQSRLGWTGRTVSHASYLINLASPNDELWEKSVALMQEEIERCETLGIGYLVHHPGAFTTSTLTEGLDRIAKAYKELFRCTKGYRTVSCLENTAGGGSTIGRTFEELADLRGRIIEATGEAERIGFCIDTCHAHAGGYDLSTESSCRVGLGAMVELLGAEHVRVLHMNDSKGKAGSRLDRHEHIGMGTIGECGFAAVLRMKELRGKPMILETPKGVDEAGVVWDTVNMRRLRSLWKD